MNISVVLRTYAKPATVLVLLLIIFWMLFRSSDVEQTEVRVLQSDIPSLLDRLRQGSVSQSSTNKDQSDNDEFENPTLDQEETENEQTNSEERVNGDDDQMDINVDTEEDLESPIDQRDSEEDQSNDQINADQDQSNDQINANQDQSNDQRNADEDLIDNTEETPDDENDQTVNEEDTGSDQKIIPVTNFHANKTGSYTFKFERYATLDDAANVRVPDIDCAAIIKGDESAIENAKTVQKTLKTDANIVDKLLELTKSCDSFLKHRKYLLYPVNQEEAEFPIAFSIVMYKDVFQVERLLRAIYRPQNLYCVHIDQKSAPIIHEIMHNIAGCLDNVFIASKVHDVKWGWFSVVKPELACMEDLLKHPKPWYYFVNTCGQEFPIKTNYELIRILKAFNGSNDVQGRRSDIISQVLTRIKYGFTKEGAGAQKYLKPEFPYNITWAKGAVHVAITRGFVDFIINTKIGQEFVKYINDTPHASEHMFNPLHLSPQLGVPGSYTGYPDIRHDPQQGISVIRYKIWADTPRKYRKWQCHGVWSRQICIMSLGDLHLLVQSGKLFVNKFHATYHPLAYDCLEEYVLNNTRLDIQGVDRLNLTYYEKLDFVKNHI